MSPKLIVALCVVILLMNIQIVHYMIVSKDLDIKNIRNILYGWLHINN